MVFLKRTQKTEDAIQILCRVKTKLATRWNEDAKHIFNDHFIHEHRNKNVSPSASYLDLLLYHCIQIEVGGYCHQGIKSGQILFRMFKNSDYRYILRFEFSLVSIELASRSHHFFSIVKIVEPRSNDNREKNVPLSYFSPFTEFKLDIRGAI